MKRQAPEIRWWLWAGNSSRQVRSAALGGVIVGTLGLWAPNAGALAFRVPNQDAAAIARGNAFVATADNPSAIYYNPAGITQLEGQNLQAGSLFYLGIYGDYKSPSGEAFSNDPEVIPVPTLQYTITPREWPVSFGFGVYAPFGFSVKWPNDVPFRQESLEGSLTYMTLNPIVAWKVFPSLSLGAGPTFNYSSINLVQGLLANPNLLPGDQAEFDGDDWGYGFNAGVLWQPHPKWSFGASYRSSTCMNYNGDFTLNPALAPLPKSTSASSELEFPQIVIGGISYRPTPKWNLEFDVDWTDWTSIQNLTITGPPVPTRKLNWEGSFMYEFGVTHYFDNGYYLSAGYFFSQASTPSQYYTPMVPDTDLHIGSVGGGYKGEHWSWALALQIIGGCWRTVTVDPSAGPNASTGSGSYKLFTPTLSFSVGYRF